METIQAIPMLRDTVRAWKSARKTVAFVPTMGALHAGHAACIETARRYGDALVVSIYVNPTQFGPGEDFEAYPSTLADDLRLCESLGCDAVFAPRTRDIYPTEQRVWVEPGDLASRLCGRARKGHFRGVCTVVAKLFHLVDPDVAVFGQKDAQQALVIRRMVEQLNMPVRIEICPVVREEDGLACSSRNRYLDAGGRKRAARIYEALVAGRRAIAGGERAPDRVCAVVRSRLEAGGAVDVEYVELLRADTLEALERIEGRVLLAVAGRVGRTRLIDNLVLRVSDPGGVSEEGLF